MSPFPIPRRWMRHPVDLPVSVTVNKGNSTVRVPGRVSEISEGGMALYAGVQMVAGDRMKVEFETPGHTQMEGIVRSKAGCCFGVEFVAPLAEENQKAVRPQAATPAAATRSQAELWVLLRRKEQEIQRLRNEIDILHALARRGRP
jgi:PilZ domain